MGSNYPLPVVEIDAAKVRLQEALRSMWEQEAAYRAAIENGTEEGLGDSAEALIEFPQDLRMDVDREPVRNNFNQTDVSRHHQDQMVPSITSTLFRVEDYQTSSDFQQHSASDGRAEVPRNVNTNQERAPQNQRVLEARRRNNAIPPPQVNHSFGMLNMEESTAESSSTTSGGRSSGVVPVWSPSSSTFADQYIGDEAAMGPSSSFWQRHPQSHERVNWRPLSQTG